MELINNFDLRRISPHKILFVVTSGPAYEMNRVMLAENYPEIDSFALVSGFHCSCYGFDETTWDAQILSRAELGKVLVGWIDHGVDIERKMADLAIAHIDR